MPIIRHALYNIRIEQLSCFRYLEYNLSFKMERNLVTKLITSNCAIHDITTALSSIVSKNKNKLALKHRDLKINTETLIEKFSPYISLNVVLLPMNFFSEELQITLN